MKYASYYIYIQASHSSCFRNKTIVHGECLSSFSSCSFAYPWAALLLAKCQRYQAFILHGSTVPHRETHQSCQSYTHITIYWEIALSYRPPTPQQISNPTTCVSLQYEMEKPAAKATAATVNLAIGRNRCEGERSPLKLRNLCCYFYSRRSWSTPFQVSYLYTLRPWIRVKSQYRRHAREVVFLFLQLINTVTTWLRSQRENWDLCLLWYRSALD